MKLVNFSTGGGPRIGLVSDGTVIDLLSASQRHGLHADEAFNDMQSFIEGGIAARASARSLAEIEQNAKTASTPPGSTPLSEVNLLAPVPHPGKIVCVGLNYLDHCLESGTPVPERPILFSKFPTSLIGHGEKITWCLEDSTQVDYEAELAVVIGKRGRRIPAERSRDYIAGYSLLNDISARDIQFEDGQWVRGKSFDTFCPMGPYLVTPDELADPQNIGLRCRLNGILMQDSNTNQMIFKIPEIIAFVSATCTLMPGDVIATGTPHGVGFTRNPPVFLRPGDVVEVEADGLGRLVNPVASMEEHDASS